MPGWLNKHKFVFSNPEHVTFIVGVGTKIDPTLCRADRMVGQVLGAVGALPDIYTELTISFFLLRRLLGVKTEGDKRGAKVCFEYICEYQKKRTCSILFH